MKSKRKRRYIRWVLWTSLILLPVALYLAMDLHRSLTEGKVIGPTLIDDIRAGSITASDVRTIEFLKFGDPGPFGIRPFTKSQQFERLPKQAVHDPASIRHLIEILSTGTFDNRTYHNHPGRVHRGLMRIGTRDGGHYYLYHEVYLDRDRWDTHYASFEVGAKYNLNINGTESYENILLGGFVKKHDPWFPKGGKESRISD